MTLNLFLGSVLNYIFNDFVTHIPFHFLRINFLRLFNKNIDPSVKVLMHTKILNFWKIQIGKNVVINQYCLLDCRVYQIRISENVDIGPYTRIWTLGHDSDDANHSIKGADVIIEDHVWIASGVTVLPGCRIGRGAVLAAGSVVHKTVNSMEIVAGNPAKFIKTRNNDLKYELIYTPLFN